MVSMRFRRGADVVEIGVTSDGRDPITMRDFLSAIDFLRGLALDHVAMNDLRRLFLERSSGIGLTHLGDHQVLEQLAWRLASGELMLSRVVPEAFDRPLSRFVPEPEPPPASPGPVAEAVAEPTTGHLIVTLTELTSRQPIDEVDVRITGPATKWAPTAANGERAFDNLPPGAYDVTLKNREFQYSPSQARAQIRPGETTRLALALNRVMISVIAKRIHAKGFARAAAGDKSEIEYGHWWLEIDIAESYGWWPAEQVGVWGTLSGVRGILNGQGPQFHGTPTLDPHHGDAAEEAFHPRALNGRAAADIKDCLRGFAKGYSGNWSWPLGQNCHSFQEAMMAHCGLSKQGSKTAASP
jgi:hypothetical protein